MPDESRLTVVVPAHCEQEGLGRVIGEVARELEALALDYHIVVVDDGSTDSTWSVVRALCAANTRVAGIRLSRQFGKEAALAVGLERAPAGAVMVMDGDGQHPPSLIPVLVARWRQGDVDAVEAVKSDRGSEPPLHRLGARIFAGAMNRLSGHDLREASDFKLLDRRVVEAWRRLPERNLFFRGMVAWLGFRRARVPFAAAPRTAGRSGFTFRSLFTLGVTAVTAYSIVPLRLIALCGAAFLLLAVALGLQTLWVWGSGRAVSGFTTVILLLLALGSALLMGLGVIGEYVARIYQEVKGRPRAIAAEQIGSLEPPGPSA